MSSEAIPEGQNAIEAIDGSHDTTIEENDLVGNWLGVFIADAPETKILSNDMRQYRRRQVSSIRRGTKILPTT